MKRIHGGNILEVTEKYKLSPEQIFDFSTNVNPLGPSPKALESIKTNLGQISKYPESSAGPLVSEIARYCGVKPNEIIAANGSTQLIYLVPRTLKPKSILIIQPTFCEYEYSARIVNTEVKFINTHSENNFKLNIDKVIEELEGVNMLFLCNPNNPTGQLLTKEDVLRVTKAAAKEGTYAVIDEAFIDFVDEESAIKEVAQQENLIVLRSLTKFFGLSGLRLGFGVSNKKVIDKLKSLQEPWSVNCFAQAAGIAVLNDKEHIAKTLDFINAERDFLHAGLSSIKGLKVYDSRANFLLFEIKDNTITSTKLWNGLAKKGVVIRDCSSFASLGKQFVRVAVRTRRENLKLLEELSNLC